MDGALLWVGASNQAGQATLLVLLKGDRDGVGKALAAYMASTGGEERRQPLLGI